MFLHYNIPPIRACWPPWEINFRIYFWTIIISLAQLLVAGRLRFRIGDCRSTSDWSYIFQNQIAAIKKHDIKSCREDRFVPAVAAEFTNVLVLLCMASYKSKQSITTTDAVFSNLSLNNLWELRQVYDRQTRVSILYCFEYHCICFPLYLSLFVCSC